MKVSTITTQAFVSGRYRWDSRRIGRHNYRARWVEGRGLVVTDNATKAEIAVTCAGTQDNRTLYVRVDGEGFIIGGWQYPHRAMPFKALVESINRGLLYEDMADLPKRRQKAVDH